MEKPLRENPTTGFPLRLEIPHNPRDTHFPTATTAARLPFRLHLKWRDNPAYGYILEWLDASQERFGGRETNAWHPLQRPI